ncbi:hypothetical protein Hypma_002295 [Hypsizygus marmoreus]|uniref:Uncharacterized protein n=1 Tax=Hypsizygus marmoreus TaxID=39966 RepID=A0A369KAK0_HYPMA|nr:hypothetical protein Hypma_002295 [Hypsizygus marmoreus]
MGFMPTFIETPRRPIFYRVVSCRGDTIYIHSRYVLPFVGATRQSFHFFEHCAGALCYRASSPHLASVETCQLDCRESGSTPIIVQVSV